MRSLLIALSIVFISTQAMAFMGGSGFGEGDVKMRRYSIDGDPTTGLYFDPDSDSVNEIVFNADGSITCVGAITLGDLTFPTTDGTVGQAIVTDGNGTLSFSTVIASPAGSDTYIQYNNGGSFGGESTLTYNDSTNSLSIGGDLTVTGDDLFMGTNTTGYILRADGTNYNPVKFDDSSDLSGFLDDETGTGVAVFGTAPTFTTKITSPEVENSGNITIDAINAASASTVTITNSNGTYVANVEIEGESKAENVVSTDDADINDNLTVGDIIIDEAAGVLDFTGASSATISSSVFGTISFADDNISNVGDIALDSISSDAGTSISITLGTDAGDDLLVSTNALVVEGDTRQVGIGTTDPSYPLEVSGSIYAYLSGADGEIAITDSSDNQDVYITTNGESYLKGGDFLVQSTTTVKPIITVQNTTDDATAGYVKLSSDRATPADEDVCGTIQYEASDDAGTQTVVASIVGTMEEVANGNEAGRITFNVMLDDGSPALENFLDILGDNGSVGQGKIKFNEGSQDIDIICETNDQDNMFVIDSASNDFTVSRDLASANTDDALVNFTNDNTGDDQPLLQLQQDSPAAVISANGISEYMGAVSLADGAQSNLAAMNGQSGFGLVECNGNYAYFAFTSAAAVTLITHNNCSTTEDNDTTFNIFDDGTTITIENELGDTYTAKYKLWY